MNTLIKLQKKLKWRVLWTRLGSFGQLDLSGDPKVDFKKSRIGPMITKDPKYGHDKSDVWGDIYGVTDTNTNAGEQ